MKKMGQKAFLSVAPGFFALLCAFIFSCAFAKDDAEPGLTRATDLQADAKLAAEKKIPIVLFSNLTGCHYCRGALRNVLLPMQRNEGWARTAIYRQIDVDRKTPMKDFDGKATTHEAFMQKMKMQFTPTILVVDGAGKNLADPIIGIAAWDFYGYNVEEAVRRGFEATQK